MADETLFLRPGSLILIAVILVFGLAIFNWSSDFLAHSGNESLGEGKKSVDCTVTKVKFLDSERNSTHYTVFVSVNTDVPGLAVKFVGEERNSTRVFNEPAPGSVKSASASLDNLRRVDATVQGCLRMFHYRP